MAQFTAESIPDADSVSRACFELPGTMPPEAYFQFPYDGVRDEKAESVYWRKYAPTIADVHSRGCALEEKKSEAKKYLGAQTIEASAIRVIKSGRGHSFNVTHVPLDDDRAHAHIAIQRASGPIKKLSKNDRLELTALLVECFGEEIDRHNC